MRNYNQFVTLTTTLAEQMASYANSPTKEESARMRKTISKMQKLAVATKCDLIAAHKA